MGFYNQRASDPFRSYPCLFYDRTRAGLRNARFHPGQGLSLLADVASADTASETVRSDKELPQLTDQQWTGLHPVGELKTTAIAFGRGSANLTLDSERDLQDLARRLQSFPRFYLRVIGHARAEGDPEANRVLALARATAAAQLLISQGVGSARIRTEAALPSARGGEAQVVSFVVGQVPY